MFANLVYNCILALAKKGFEVYEGCYEREILISRRAKLAFYNSESEYLDMFIAGVSFERVLRA